MASAIIKVTAFGIGTVIADLRGFNIRSLNLTAPLKRAEALMHASIDRNFRESGRPKKWKPLTKAYLKRKLAQGYSPKPLVRRGARGLQGSITGKVTRLRLILGTNIPYAAVHQFGGGNNIPARKYLLFQKDDVRQINDLVVEHLMEKKIGR